MQRWDYLAEVAPLPCAIDSWPSANRANEGRNVQYLSNNNILNPKSQPQIVTPTTKYVDITDPEQPNIPQACKLKSYCVMQRNAIGCWDG